MATGEDNSFGVMHGEQVDENPEWADDIGVGSPADDRDAPVYEEHDNEHDNEEYTAISKHHDEPFVNPSAFFSRPVLTPADGMRPNSRLYKREESRPAGAPPPSRGPPVAGTRPSLIQDPALMDSQEVHTPHVPLKPAIHKIEMGYKGATPYLTTYNKTYTPELRKADRDYESHEGERRPRQEITPKTVAKKLLQQVGDKIRERAGGKSRLRTAWKAYARDQSMGLDGDELRAALRMFNFPMSRTQSDVLFSAVAEEGDGLVHFDSFMTTVERCQYEW